MTKPSILIVEDEVIVAEDLAYKVRQLGYEVAGMAMTGEEAVTLAQRCRPALVLMDVRLAGAMDGIEAARLIHDAHQLPVLFLTAHSDEEMVDRARQAEAYGYILKPYDDRDLRIQIEMALYKWHSEGRLRESKERLAGINRFLQAALTSASEDDLARACLEVAKNLTQSRLGFIGGVHGSVFTPFAICSCGTDLCLHSDAGVQDASVGTSPICGFCDKVLGEGRSLLVNDPANHPDYIGQPSGSSPFASFLGVPLQQNKSVVGVLAVCDREHGYTGAEQETLEALVPSIVEAFARKRAERALQALNNELEQRVEQRTLELQKTQKQYLHAEKLSAIGKLSASIAHEFNNPLQGILAVLKSLKRREVLDAEDGELLDGAIEEGDRIKELIRSLQEYNRPSPGRKSLVDINKALESVLLLHKSDCKGKRITLVRAYDERLPKVEAISDQIKQVFLNLLINAVDACHLPGGVITVTTWRENEERVAVSIRDTGVGIQPSELGMIFQPFYTTKSEVKGTGLGLSVCYGIVTHHQGEMRVESAPGEGSTFTVVLPIVNAALAS